MKLYHREKETRQLRVAYEHCRSSSSLSPLLVLVTGVSGVGKTALVEATFGQQDCWLVRGKFDQLDRIDHYSALVGAMTELVDRIIERKNKALLETLRECMGNERALVDLVPALQLVLQTEIGYETETTDGSVGDFSASTHKPHRAVQGGAGVQQRLMFGLKQFLTIVCEHASVVMFWDDLQWAKPSSLEFIAALVTDQIPGLVMVGACRGNEVTVDDHLSVVLRELEADGVVIEDIHLEPFDAAALQVVVADQMGLDETKSRELAVSTWRQTSGNIFFVLQLLQSYIDGEISADDRQYTSSVDLLENRIAQFSQDAQDVLMVAACMGAEFDEYLLDKAVSFDVKRPLSVAEAKGLIVHCNGTWRFAHDQIQESAYSLIPDHERPTVHLRIGRRLWKTLSPGDLRIHVFVVVNQLRQGVDLITDAEERKRLAKLLLTAGELATKSSAFPTAAEFLKLGTSLLNQRSRWRDDYTLSLNLYNALAEVLYCIGSFSEMDAVIGEILQHARSSDDRSRALVASVYSLGARHQLQRAIDLGLEILSHSGHKIPSRPSVISVVLELIKTKRILRHYTDDDLINLPRMRDPRQLAAVRMMNFLTFYAAVGRPMLVPLLTMRLVRASIQWGAGGSLSVGYAAVGMLFCNAFNDIEFGVRFAKIGLRMLDKWQAKEWLPRVYMTVHAFCLPHISPLRGHAKPLLYAYRIGLGTGDIEGALLCAALYVAGVGQSSQISLPALIQEGRVFLEQMNAHNQTQMALLLQVNMQFYACLVGQADDSSRLNGAYVTIDTAIRDAKESGNSTYMEMIMQNQLMLFVLFGKYDDAARLADENSKLRFDAHSPNAKSAVWLHLGIAYMASLSRSRKGKRRRIRATRQLISKLKGLAVHSQDNFQFMVHFLEAELAAVHGAMDESRKQFEQAMRLSAEQERWLENALACERGFYVHHCGEHRKWALHSYEKAGALAKVLELKVPPKEPSSTLSCKVIPRNDQFKSSY